VKAQASPHTLCSPGLLGVARANLRLARALHVTCFGSDPGWLTSNLLGVSSNLYQSDQWLLSLAFNLLLVRPQGATCTIANHCHDSHTTTPERQRQNNDHDCYDPRQRTPRPLYLFLLQAIHLDYSYFLWLPTTDYCNPWAREPVHDPLRATFELSSLRALHSHTRTRTHYMMSLVVARSA
jgi:hypothetical protein